jgi:hypothetical protein
VVAVILGIVMAGCFVWEKHALENIKITPLQTIITIVLSFLDIFSLIYSDPEEHMPDYNVTTCVLVSDIAHSEPKIEFSALLFAK